MASKILIIEAFVQISTGHTMGPKEQLGNRNLIASDICEGNDEVTQSDHFEANKERIPKFRKYALYL